MKWIIILGLLCSTASASSLQNITGKMVIGQKTFEWEWNMAQEATIVVFLSAVCPCSNSHVAYLKNLKEDNPEFKFIGVHSNVDEDAKTTLEYFQKIALNFDIIQDDHAKLANILAAYRTPHAYLISKEGKILYQGGVTSSATASKAQQFYLADAMMAVNNGKSIRLKQTRVLGCEIARY